MFITQYAPITTDIIEHQVAQDVAKKLSIQLVQVIKTLELMSEGATVPFIARYRKEITGGLDDTQLRDLVELHTYSLELTKRKETILNSIFEQGKLTEELLTQISNSESKQRIEDLYAPYKPKRRSKAHVAREKGLQPLADLLEKDITIDANIAAQDYLTEEVKDIKAALDGARDILAEQWSESADLVAILREKMSKGDVTATEILLSSDEELLYQSLISGERLHDVLGKLSDQEQKNHPLLQRTKFKDLFNSHQPLEHIPSHRALALFRGQNLGFLKLTLDIDTPEILEKNVQHPVLSDIAQFFNYPENKVLQAQHFLYNVIRWTWKIKLQPQLETELLQKLKEQADAQAIDVFAGNLKNLLLAAPAGAKKVLGLDPGFRTGIKVAMIDETGKILYTGVLYPDFNNQGHAKNDQAVMQLAGLCQKFQPQLCAIGNGTASRETETLMKRVISDFKISGLIPVVVSEAGASVYSASSLAAKEMPDLDVTVRGAVSIARRLQDPLAELVKIDPKAIGVGQYQHDVTQKELNQGLENVVEDCVNQVGVDINTASVSLLERISGLNATLAQNIVNYRESNGAFNTRQELKKVPRLGPKAFEQAAAFLRIHHSIAKNPLDNSSVHPERYELVEKMKNYLNISNILEVIGKPEVIQTLNQNKQNFIDLDKNIGLPTIMDILKELEKPGRDPRPEFITVHFSDEIKTVGDLEVGMKLQGVITNVANFGAFVDIGVHQDGLIHVSQLSDDFVTDAHKIVKVGQIVMATVLEIDEVRKRIALTLKSKINTNSSNSLNQSKQSKNTGRAGNSSSLNQLGSLGNALQTALKRKS